MNDPGFPGQHTTTTTVTSETTVQTDTRFDPTYIRTIPGALKVAQISLNLLIFICVEASGPIAYHSRGVFFNFVAMTGFWFTGILLLLYLFHLVERFYKIPWLKIELGFCTLWTVFLLIGSCLAATLGVEAFKAAAFFGFCNMLAYGADAYFKLRAVQNGEIAQGERITMKHTTNMQSPAY